MDDRGDAARNQTHERLDALTEHHPLLAVLTPEQCRMVRRFSEIVDFRTKRLLIRENDAPHHVFCLLSGVVRVFHRSKEGVELMLRLLYAPAMFGDTEVVSRKHFSEYYITLEPSAILQMPANLFRRLLTMSSTFAEAVALDSAQRSRMSIQHLKCVTFVDIEARLANLLLDYAAVFATPDAGALRIELPLSHAAMAKDLAVARKSVLRAVNNLRQSGIIDKRRARYVILDAERLRDVAAETVSVAFRTCREHQRTGRSCI